MKERLLHILNQENLTSSRLAEMLDVQPSNISHILSGRNKPGYDFIEKLVLKFPKINPDWLITGRGEMYREQQILDFNFSSEPGNPAVMSDNQSIFDSSLEIERIVVFYKDHTFKSYKPGT